MISAIADIHFAPTRVAADSLAVKGAPASSIHVTGNTVVDALEAVRERLRGPERAALASSEILRLAEDQAPLVVASCHRREGLGTDLEAICRAILRVARGFPSHRIVFSVHLNPIVRKPVTAILGREPDVHLIEPVSYPELLFLLSRARLVLTDSGGIQEEAPSFAVPVLVLRKYTERPEAVEAGLAFLVGPNEGLIVRRATELLNAVHTPRIITNPFGDGHAAERIVEVLARAI